VDVRTTTAKPRRARRAVPTEVATPAAELPPPVSVPENPKGAISGYVATRSLAGTKTNTPLNETPQSISVVGTEQIRDLKPQKLDEITRYSPGVRGETFGADTRNDWFLIRGFPAQQDGLFLDGLMLFNTAFATWKLQPFGLERLEVLRGPSAVLYGGSAPGGLLNAVSKAPPTKPVQYLEFGINNYGNGYMNFDVGGPVAIDPSKGQLFMRLLGTLKGGGTQTDFVNDDSYFIAPSVTYKPDVDTSITILTQASRDNTKGNAWLPYIGTVTPAPFGKIPTSFFVGDPSVDYFKRDQIMAGYQFEKKLDDTFTFRQNARIANVQVQYNTLLGNGYDGPPANATLNRFQFYANDNSTMGNLDSQLEARFNTGILQHKALIGVDYRNYRISDFQSSGFPIPPINIFNPSYGVFAPISATIPFRNGVQSLEQTGLYLQDQIKLDRWTLVLSGRNDWADLGNVGIGSVNETRHDSQATGRVGLIYNADYGLSPYVSYATGYNPQVALNTTVTPNTLLAPETSQQAEVGVKWEPIGYNGSIDIALFDLKRQNVLTPDQTNPLFSIQQGEVTSRGLELSTVSNLTKELKLVGQFTAYRLFVSKDGDPTVIGKVPVNTPSRLASVWGDYTFKEGPLTGFGFGLGVRYVGGSFADPANTLPVPDYVVGDASVHYEWDKWRAAINVSNFTDRAFVASCQTPTVCFYGDRIRATASIAYRW
jgi:iron complex outermembrane receptor protein